MATINLRHIGKDELGLQAFRVAGAKRPCILSFSLAELPPHVKGAIAEGFTLYAYTLAENGNSWETIMQNHVISCKVVGERLGRAIMLEVWACGKITYSTTDEQGARVELTRLEALGEVA